jgi:hypothetical protein
LKHIQRLLTQDEILDIEKGYSFWATIKKPLPVNPTVDKLYERNIVEKVPYLTAHIKLLQDQLNEANYILNGLRK